ncbi:mannonate dehydratase [Xinfangfangia sp. D13-10-4-6]|nr:mannonate dehydratase [Pseudogemmobacter hezensis]NPD16055.1 mannonate dehydratase [Pseudogemmobacter hezensis]
MEECFRWYGPGDPVSLDEIRQAGATGIVTALHHIYDGSVWSVEEIAKHKALIEASGLRWSVVESIPVHNTIKLGQPERQTWVAHYQQTIRNLAANGIYTICYNFMPVCDWTRTDLAYPMPGGGLALRFDALDCAAYDLFVLKRPNAEAGYSAAQITEAKARFDSLTPERIALIEKNLIAGLPATERSYDRESFLAALAEYDGIDRAQLAANLTWFLEQIVPVAEEVGARLCIHPDDPAFPLFGLPRVVSTREDARRIVDCVKSPANGLTFCSGSYGSREDNDLTAMAQEFAAQIHFTHLRNVQREADGSFYEADHLGGSSDLPALIQVFLDEQARRLAEGRADWQIPVRPDHGHQLADDIAKTRVNPGYTLIGRLKGLAEIRGVMHGIEVARRA